MNSFKRYTLPSHFVFGFVNDSMISIKICSRHCWSHREWTLCRGPDLLEKAALAFCEGGRSEWLWFDYHFNFPKWSMSRHFHSCLELENVCCREFGLISRDHTWVPSSGCASPWNIFKTAHDLFFTCVPAYVQPSLQKACWHKVALTSTVLFPDSSECISAARSETNSVGRSSSGLTGEGRDMRNGLTADEEFGACAWTSQKGAWGSSPYI